MKNALAMGGEIVQFEGRFDSKGDLLVYKLPTGDGGGAYEVAGINERYHPGKARELKTLIESGQNKKALKEAVEYIEFITRPVRAFFPNEQTADQNPGLEFILRDVAFNRGLKGAATILQIALGVTVDGFVGPKTKEEFGRQIASYGQSYVMHEVTRARETYERTTYPWKGNKRDESSKFWRGLANRWSKAQQSAGKFA